jgi:hypothetical protein
MSVVGQLETKKAGGSRGRHESPSPPTTDVLAAARPNGESVPFAVVSMCSNKRMRKPESLDHLVGAGDQ